MMINFVDKIYDNVWGFIEITELERKLINSPFFQRLREIKQLGFAYYVFPGATHTRFSHSIGVMSIAYKMVKNIIQNSDTSNEIEEITNNIKKIRVAALLHDIGHYPFSHTIEKAYKDYGAEDRSNKLEDVIKGIINNDVNDVPDSETEIERHEHLGAYIILNTDYENGITKILKEDFQDEDIDDIANIIQKKSSTLWFNNIINSEMDADRFDYLIRDSRETGVSYGNFDLDYLIRHLKLAEFNESNGCSVRFI